MARSLWAGVASAAGAAYRLLAWIFLHGLAYDLLQRCFGPAYEYLRMKQRWLAARRVALRPGAVLDYACGSGYIAEVFAPGEYVGADINGSYAEFARRRYPAHRFVHLPGDGATPFAAGSFDWALLLSTLHHLDDGTLARILRECRRVLRPDGRLMVIDTLPAADQQAWIVRFMIRMDMGEWFRTAAEMEAAFAPSFV
ncbi:MAG: class I SAM-dependent methyltransferase, partial [Planctomycetes bacterium]|nr:class I SAM-dependent methyltransferase [Planctomycetota bacterium]